MSEKKLKNYIKNTNRISLYTILSGRRYDLKKGRTIMKVDKDFLEYIGNLVADTVGGNVSTKNAIKYNIRAFPKFLLKKNSWMLERITFRINKVSKEVICSYTAGQDYEAEIKQVRNYLKK